MPHPGGRYSYPLNPHGVGLYADQSAATDQPLPQIERPDQLVRRWNDQPEPGGFAPCPDLVALRFPKQPAVAVDPESPPSVEEIRADVHTVAKRMLSNAWRMQHHAAGDLILDGVVPKILVEATGIGRDSIRFHVPPPPVKVHTRRHRTVEETRGRLCSLHIDADNSFVRMVYAYPFHYAPQRSPEWVEVFG
jgi:hypothetical protein